MGNGSNLIVTVGLAVFVIGAGATFFVVRNGSGGESKSTTPTGSTALYTAKDIPSGTTGAQVIEQGYVKTRSVSASANRTYLVAVTAPEAERLVYFTSFNFLYYSLVSTDAATVGPTPGSSSADALKQLC